MANQPNYSGADPISISQTKVTYDLTASGVAPQIEIDHVYYTKAVLKDGDTFNHVVKGVVTLLNNSSLVTLKHVSLYIQVDTTASVHQPFLCDENGGNLQSTATIAFGDIDPNSHSQSLPYYWTLKHSQNLPEPGSFTVTPKYTPEYTVSYPTAWAVGDNDETTVFLTQP